MLGRKVVMRWLRTAEREAICELLLLAVAVVAVAICASGVQANTCSARSVSVHGTVRGVVFDPMRARISNVELQLHHDSVLAARFHTDARGEFVFDFSSLPKGEYQLTTTAAGFLHQVGAIKIAGWRPKLRNRTLSVQLALFACGGGIGWGKTPHERVKSRPNG